VPRGVTFLPELPHTPLGKVQKFRLTAPGEASFDEGEGDA
jgi:acyl-coenzyme A synthetase/AMP-(fatty) acid ligase